MLVVIELALVLTIVLALTAGPRDLVTAAAALVGPVAVTLTAGNRVLAMARRLAAGDAR